MFSFKSTGSDSEDDFSTDSDDDAEKLGLDSVPAEFYDPDADEKDEKWVQKLRQGKSKNSDAILSCPLCFTTVCVDCQQHATEENQFRAMFVMNCKVDTSKVVKGEAESGSKKRKKTPVAEEDENEGNEQYNPVHCAACDNELGVREIGPTGLYHFFHVVASNS